MGKRRKPRHGPPPVEAADFLTGEVGPPIYHTPIPSAKTRGRLVAGNKLEVTAVALGTSPGEVLVRRARAAHDTRPLVPASEEVAKLPRAAREAFAARCAARVAKLRDGAASPEAAAALILAAATVRTPIRKQLLCVRRDFDRIARLAREHDWTDDTPVPPEAFGPMWPEGLTPGWAQEPQPPAPAATGQVG